LQQPYGEPIATHKNYRQCGKQEHGDKKKDSPLTALGQYMVFVSTTDTHSMISGRQPVEATSL
jgi:hypothetical protein